MRKPAKWNRPGDFRATVTNHSKREQSSLRKQRHEQDHNNLENPDNVVERLRLAKEHYLFHDLIMTI